MVENVNWESVGAIVAATVGLVTVMYRAPKAYAQLRKWCGRVFGTAELKDDLACVAGKLDYVVSELLPNGGSSIRDSLNRIESRQVLQDQRQRAILSDMSVGVFETDEFGQCIWVNRKYLRMTGRTLAEVSGSGWANILADEDRVRVVAGWTAAINEQREFEMEYRIVSPDGKKTKVRVQSYKMHDAGGAPLGYLGIMTPITEGGTKVCGFARAGTIVCPLLESMPPESEV